MRRCIDPVDLSAWVDGEVNLRRSRAIRQHVESCPLCAAEVAALQRVRQAVRLLAGSDPGHGAELWVTAQPGQRRQRRQGNGEAQRLLKRLRAELTKEQARVVWGRGLHATAWRPAFLRVRSGWSWTWPAVAFALLLVAGIAGSLRGFFLSSLSGSSASAPQPAVSRDAVSAPVQPATGRLATAKGESYPAGDGTGRGTGLAGQVEQTSPVVTAAGSPAGGGGGSGGLYRSSSSYARGEVKLATNATQALETRELVLWPDGTAAQARAPADVAAVTPHAAVTPSVAWSVETERVTGEIAVGVNDEGKVTVAGGPTVASGGSASGFPDSSDTALVSTVAVSTLADPADQPVGRSQSGRATTGARPAAVNAVRPATISAAATGEKKAADKAAGKEDSSNESERSEPEYQREHERYAATVGADPVDSPEEALIKRVLLAATAP